MKNCKHKDDTCSDLLINAGFIDLRKKTTFYWFALQNCDILSMDLCRSFKKVSMPLNSPLRPFVSMCAKYLLSFERRATAYLAER